MAPLQERMSTEDTRAERCYLIPKVGDSLLTNQRRPILTVVEDTCGVHDTLISCCSAYRYRVRHCPQQQQWIMLPCWQCVQRLPLQSPPLPPMAALEHAPLLAVHAGGGGGLYAAALDCSTGACSLAGSGGKGRQGRLR